MDLTLRYAVLSFWLAWLCGCSGRETLWLLELCSLDSSVAEVGSTLEFSGRGLPVGRPGELMLRGELLAPGASPKRVSLTLKAQAATSTRASAFVDDRAVRVVGGHATFRGNAELRFASAAGPWVAGGLSNVVLEWAGREDNDDAAVRREGEGLLTALGVEVNESATEMGTVRVTDIHGDSVAAREGIRIGERIERFNGLHVRSLADLAPPSAAKRVELVLRDAVDVPRRLDLEIPRLPGAAFAGLRYLFWACPVILALMFLGPWPAPLDVVRVGVRRLRRERFLMFRPLRGAPHSRSTSLAWTAACAAASCFAAWEGSGVTLAAALAAYAMLNSLRTWRSDRVPSSKGDERRQRARRAITHRSWVLAHGGMLSVASIGSAVLGGASSLSLLASEQGAAPWGWSLFARPSTWLAAWIVLACAARLSSNSVGSRSDVAFDNAARCLLAAVICSMWLGGSSTGLNDLPPALELGLGSAVFAVKTFGVLCALAFVQPLVTASLRTLGIASGVLLLANIVWVCVAPAREVELHIGGAVLVSLAAVGCIAAAEHWSHRRVPRVPPSIIALLDQRWRRLLNAALALRGSQRAARRSSSPARVDPAAGTS
jgi:hypothetical protein